MGAIATTGAEIIKEFERRLVAPVRAGRPFVTEGLRPESDEWDDPSTWEEEGYDRYYKCERDGWSVAIAMPGLDVADQCADMQYFRAADMDTAVPEYMAGLSEQGYKEVDAPASLKVFLTRSHRFLRYMQTDATVEHPHTIAAFARSFEEEPCYDADGSEWRLQIRDGLISEV